MLMLICPSRIGNAQEESQSREDASPPGLSAASLPFPEKIGVPLEDDIVAFYVPPTRAKEPCAATRTTVHRLYPRKSRWVEIYRLPSDEAEILAVRGYVKSSKPLYVVHTRGVARSKDGGESWHEALPPAYLESADEFIAAAVNPADREEAVVAATNRAWSTGDYGASWSALALPSGAEPLTALAYAGGDRPFLVAATTNALYCTRDLGKTWTALMRKVEGPRLLATVHSRPLAYTYDSSRTIRCFDLSRLGSVLEAPIELPGQPAAIAADSQGRGALWLGQQASISLWNLQKPDPAGKPIHESSAGVGLLQPHPRVASGLFWTVGPQLFYLPNAFGEGASALALALAPAAFSLPGEPPAVIRTQDSLAQDSGEAAALLDRLLVKQPPLEEVVSAVLKYANHSPKDTERWKRTVRNRNLLPRLSLQVSEREYPFDRYDAVTHVDRFGVPTQDTLHLSDEAEDVGSYGWN